MAGNFRGYYFCVFADQRDTVKFVTSKNSPIATLTT